MSATTHTPGQWHVHITPRSFVEVRATTPNGLPFVVARVSTRDCLGTSGEELADGYLIAAAPDLLDALKDARERMLGSSPSIRALIAKTDAAIAKAEGRP